MCYRTVHSNGPLPTLKNLDTTHFPPSIRNCSTPSQVPYNVYIRSISPTACFFFPAISTSYWRSASTPYLTFLPYIATREGACHSCVRLSSAAVNAFASADLDIAYWKGLKELCPLAAWAEGGGLLSTGVHSSCLLPAAVRYLMKLGSGRGCGTMDRRSARMAFSSSTSRWAA